jgi:hypothetical protein
MIITVIASHVRSLYRSRRAHLTITAGQQAKTRITRRRPTAEFKDVKAAI